MDEAKRAKDADQRLEMPFPAKFMVMPNCVFHATKPAIVGVRVLAGKVRANLRLIKKDGSDAGKVRSLRDGEEVLKETFRDYFGGLNYFFAAEQAELTYADVVAHIGVDPSEYRYDADRNAQIYSWYSAESKARVMHVWFRDGKLYACGVYNLGFPKM